MSSAAQQVMLAQKWSEKIDPTNWWMSEKLDGVRAYWSGSNFYSRQGNQFFAPAWFTKDLPKEPLDGELWCGRGLFQKTLSIIKKSKDWEKHADNWKYVTYLVFDAPGRSEAGEKYEQRVKWMEESIKAKKETTYAAVVGVCKCTGLPHLHKLLKQVLMKGGEGIMLRKPGSLYEHCRSHTLLKVKFFHDEECKVTGHEKGSGRCSNMMGKIHTVLPNGLAFKIGTGFSDAQRKNPPKIGSVVTFKYQELTEDGHPRFPVFVRERGDLTWADVLANAKAKAPYSSLKKRAIPLLQKQHSILFSTIPSRDPDSGTKIVTSNDADEDVEDEADNLLTKTSLPAVGGSPVATGAMNGKKRAGAHNTTKRMCQWGAQCYQKNSKHLAQFDHPPEDEKLIENKSGEEKEDDGEGEAPPPQQQQNKKRAKTETVTSPSASPPAAAAASSSPTASPTTPTTTTATTTKGSRVCMYGTECYNRDPDHQKRFTHPVKSAPKTKEEFIANTNQSQADLADYYQFGGDPEEDEKEEFLAEDRNERQKSIQRFSDAMLKKEGKHRADDEDEDDDDEEKGESAAAASSAVAGVAHGWFQGGGSDNDDDDDDDDAPMADAGDDTKTVAMADLPPPRRVKSGGQGKEKLQRVSSTAATEVMTKRQEKQVQQEPQAKPTKQSSRNKPTTPPAPASSSAAAAAAAAASTASSSTASTAAVAMKCVFLLPELLARVALTKEDEEGELICKKCKQQVGDHREAR